MERLITHFSVPWAQRTLSALNERRGEENRKRLESARRISPVFGRGSGKTWQEAFEASYLAKDGKLETPSAGLVRSAVIRDLSAEVPLLSAGEEALVQRMLVFGGGTMLLSAEEYAPALSLVRRLWCTLGTTDDGTDDLMLAPQLAEKIAACMQQPDYQRMRQLMFVLSAATHSLLYLNGYVFARHMLNGFLEAAQPKDLKKSERFLLRCLSAEFCHVRGEQGDLVLVHPGLFRPEDMIGTTAGVAFQMDHFTHQVAMGGMRECLREEEPAIEGLRRVLRGALRPEYGASAAVDDLKFLVKQGAPFEALTDVLGGMLGTNLTEGIRAALRRLYAETVRWPGAVSGVLN